jgi:aspartate carbamoyltransferase catalytic subunit
MKNPSPNKYVISTKQFDVDYLLEVFQLVDDMKKNPKKYRRELEDKIVATLFYEPSTRTRFSFESAVHRLGGSVITTENAAEFSSSSKGETIEDSTRVMGAYADFIIMRHFDDEASEQAMEVTTVPLINAGSGKSQHPTQSLLDAYTIYQNFGRLDNLKIALVGDLLRGRTVGSLVYLLGKFPNNNFCFVSPENSRIKDGVKEYLQEHELAFTESDNLESCLKDTDILYMTRIQKERFKNRLEYEKAKGNLILDLLKVQAMKEEAIIMHPLPRVNEISVKVDDNKRAKYFEQAANGLWVRMALLKKLNDYNYNDENNKK